MDENELRRLVSRLHEELASAETVDEQSKALLQKLTRDIEDIASRSDSPPGEKDTATSQLEEVALRFEADHPKLSMALGELADALGKIGI